MNNINFLDANAVEEIENVVLKKTIKALFAECLNEALSDVKTIAEIHEKLFSPKIAEIKKPKNVVFRTDEEREELIQKIISNPFISRKVTPEFYTEKNLRQALLFLERVKTLDRAVNDCDLSKHQMMLFYHALVTYSGVHTTRKLYPGYIASIGKF